MHWAGTGQDPDGSRVSLFSNVQSLPTRGVYGAPMDAATLTMIENLPAKTGRSLQEWFELLDQSPPATHGQGMATVKTAGASHGYANLIVTLYRDRGVQESDVVAQQFAGAKAALRPLYDAVVEMAVGLGPDVEVAPRKTAVALRRSRQFAYLEVPNARTLRVGLNLKGATPTARLEVAGGMCSHRVSISGPDEVDEELRGWLRDAYERA